MADLTASIDRASRLFVQRIQAAWCIITARNVICSRVVYGARPEDDELTVWQFGRWKVSDLAEVGPLAVECQEEDYAEAAVKELLNAGP